MLNPIVKIKEVVNNHPEQVELAKNVGKAIAIQVVIGVAAHYATKAVTGMIDSYFESETGIDEIPA
jgi:hypothetical protein